MAPVHIYPPVRHSVDACPSENRLRDYVLKESSLLSILIKNPMDFTYIFSMPEFKVTGGRIRKGEDTFEKALLPLLSCFAVKSTYLSVRNLEIILLHQQRLQTVTVFLEYIFEASVEMACSLWLCF